MYHQAHWNTSGSLTATNIFNYQWVLSTYGLLRLDQVDGQLGRNTTTAITAYQQNFGLLPTSGTFGPRTIERLNADLARLASNGQYPPTANQVASARAEQAMSGIRQPADGAFGKGGQQPFMGGQQPFMGGQQPFMGGQQPFIGGSQPNVASIFSSAKDGIPAQSIAVPPALSRMIPPETAAQLSTMPAAQVQSFLDSLSQRVTAMAADGGTPGTGKDISAVPLVAPDGNVVAAVSATPVALPAAATPPPQTTIQPKGWWEGLSDGEKAGVAIGGVVVVGGLAGLLIWATKK
jgi:hypothetical protein